MRSIHPEEQDFGDKGETNYETDEINKENMNEGREDNMSVSGTT